MPCLFAARKEAVVVAKRRSAGEGSSYHDLKGNKWQHKIYCYDENGMRKRKTFSGKTQAEAIEKAKAFLRMQGQLQDDSRLDMLVGEWLDEWIINYAKPKVRPRTLEKYISSLNCYIRPSFKLVRLCDLTPAMLQRHFNALLESGGKNGQGLSPSTISAARRYFAQCIDDAIKEGILMKNPVRMAKGPRLQRKEIAVLSKDEVVELIETAGHIDHPFMSVMMPVLIELTAHTGLRQGEVFGLKWDDVDFVNGGIYIRRSLAHVVGKGAVFQEPKTKCSRRRVLLLSGDVERLKEYRKWQRKYADELGDEFDWQNLLFTSPFGKPISPTNFSRRYFKPLLAKCRIDKSFTFHGLRHTHATLLLQQGVNPKIVQERLGHSSIKVTMDTYSHVLPDMQQQAVDALNDLFQ